jgi:hypothetical protein
MLFAMADQGSKEIIVFKSQDGEARIEVTTDYDTVWLSKEQMAQLFDRDRSVISRHIANIFNEGELEQKSNVQKMHISGADKPVEFFNLDVIISVGYRVKSGRGVEFRQWATKVLKQYLVEGFALNAARLRNAPGSLLELFKMQIQLWERQELINTEIQDEIKNIGERIMFIEAKITSTDENYFTIAGYCSMNKFPCPLHQAQEWGKAAAVLSRKRNIPTGTAHDERFGKVRTYHRDILKDVIK